VWQLSYGQVLLNKYTHKQMNKQTKKQTNKPTNNPTKGIKKRKKKKKRRFSEPTHSYHHSLQSSPSPCIAKKANPFRPSFSSHFSSPSPLQNQINDLYLFFILYILYFIFLILFLFFHMYYFRYHKATLSLLRKSSNANRTSSSVRSSKCSP
jgi:hypothetical protein